MNEAGTIIAGDLSLEINAAGVAVIWCAGKRVAFMQDHAGASAARDMLVEVKTQAARQAFLANTVKIWNSPAATPEAAPAPVADTAPPAAISATAKQIYARTPGAGRVELCVYDGPRGGVVLPLSRGQIINMHKVLGEAVRALADKSTLPEQGAI